MVALYILTRSTTPLDHNILAFEIGTRINDVKFTEKINYNDEVNTIDPAIHPIDTTIQNA